MLALERVRVREDQAAHAGVRQLLRDVGAVRFEAHDPDRRLGEPLQRTRRVEAEGVEQRHERRVRPPGRTVTGSGDEHMLGDQPKQLLLQALAAVLRKQPRDLVEGEGLRCAEHVLDDRRTRLTRQLQSDEVRAQQEPLVIEPHDLQPGRGPV